MLFHQNGFCAALFTPRLSVGHTYTDNLYLTDENEEHDFITTITPEFDLSLTGRQSELSLAYAPSYAIYSRFSEHNSLRHNADMNAASQFSRHTRIEISDSFTRTETPVTDMDAAFSEADTTVRQGRETYYTNTAAIDLINEFGADNSLDIGYTHYFIKNDDPALEDSQRHTPSIALSYWLIPNRLGTEWEATYTNRHFEDSENYNDTSGRLRITNRLNPRFDLYLEYTHEWTRYEEDGIDYQVYNPLIGLHWEKSERLTFSASAGWFYQDYDDEDSEGGVSGTVSALYTGARGTTASLTGTAGYDRSDSGAEQLGFTKFYGVSGMAARPLGRRLSVDISVDYRQNQYMEIQPERTDEIWRAGTGLTYQPLSWITLAADYTFRMLDSDIDTNDYTENRGVITITMTPRQPIRL
ncbi:MAG: outer membrane beta-barrel protein [Thermodesulfobacteriota bacterium]|nr:outer membrane beta-barrel protein [Thermodesulfobacteriota bacterium]